MFRFVFSCLVVPAATLGLAMSSHALVFDVTSTDDNPDASIDGTCADTEGACTLRAAVQEANANVDPTPDVINVPAGKFVLKETGPDENGAATGDLDLTDPVTITGAGAELTIVQGKKDRVFEVFAGATVVISDLTVTKGNIGTKKRVKQGEAFNGGGVSNQGNLTLERVIVAKNKSADDGGGVANVFGTLVMIDVLVTGNKAKDDAGGLEQDQGDITLDRVAFVKNKAKDEAGGLEIEDSTLDGVNVTFSQNKARTGGGMNAEQGGVIALTNATFYKNKAKEPSGAIQNENNGASVMLTNTVLDLHKKGACEGFIVSGGGNLETGSTCGFGAGDQSGVDKAGLGKLAENGGETPTHALEPTSPAIGAGVNKECPAVDQRGSARDDGACDVGAYEL